MVKLRPYQEEALRQAMTDTFVFGHGRVKVWNGAQYIKDVPPKTWKNDLLTMSKQAGKAPSIADMISQLEAEGYTVTYIPPDEFLCEKKGPKHNG